MSRRLRVVLDTNVVLSALVFRGGLAGRLRGAWQAERFRPLASAATVQELLRVLAYPKFGLSVDEQQELLADYLPYTSVVRIPDSPADVPACRDPHDRPFLALPAAGRAHLLVTGDNDLLSLAGRARFEIVPPADFLRRLGDNPDP